MVSLYYYKQQSQEFYTQKAEGQHSTVILHAGEEAERWGFQGQARPHSQTLLHIKTKQNKQQNSQHKGTERILNLKLWGHVLSKIPFSSLSLHPLQVRFEASSWSGHTHLLVPAVVGEKARLQFDCLSHQISGCQIRDPWGLKRAKDTRDPPPLSMPFLPHSLESHLFLSRNSLPSTQEFGTAWLQSPATKPSPFWNLWRDTLPNTQPE